MDKFEREIQEALDKNSSREFSSDDEIAYKTLYKMLDTPIVDYLPDSFADNVLKKVAVKSAKSNKESFWWLGSMIFFMMLTGLVVIGLTMSIMQINVASFFTKYTPIILMVSIVILVVQWLDRRFVLV